MSDEQVAAFAAAIQKSEALRVELMQVDQDLDTVVAVGRREGFSFSADELAGYLARLPAESGRELSDVELEEVAGGLPFTARSLCYECY